MKNFIQNPTRKVVITFDNNETLARVYENNKVITKGIARCSPEDKFDVVLGATLALDRAMDSLISKKSESKWKVVNREPKVGDYIRLRSSLYTFDVPGLIMKIDRINGDVVGVYHKNHPTAKTVNTHSLSNFPWNYYKSEFEVVERIEESAPEYRKVNRSPRVGDYIKIIRSVYPEEKPGNIYKIGVIDGNCLGVKHCDHPEHRKLYEDDDYMSDEYIWWHHRDLIDMEILEKL